MKQDQLVANMAALTSQPSKSKRRVRVQKVPQGSVQEMENMVEQSKFLFFCNKDNSMRESLCTSRQTKTPLIAERKNNRSLNC